ncbi:translation initiation factor IF-2-like [Drosophila ficusphila]|uniref:translation initiation factor IF-2-like n=1 Tax=Drosophila ficusphila TaxID=30025 RepID=UPI001C89C041|nr:translation initiation factor IF-2-like [Drosophila ficusphila]
MSSDEEVDGGPTGEMETVELSSTVTPVVSSDEEGTRWANQARRGYRQVRRVVDNEGYIPFGSAASSERPENEEDIEARRRATIASGERGGRAVDTGTSAGSALGAAVATHAAAEDADATTTAAAEDADANTTTAADDEGDTAEDANATTTTAEDADKATTTTAEDADTATTTTAEDADTAPTTTAKEEDAGAAAKDAHAAEEADATVAATAAARVAAEDDAATTATTAATSTAAEADIVPGGSTAETTHVNAGILPGGNLGGGPRGHVAGHGARGGGAAAPSREDPAVGEVDGK